MKSTFAICVLVAAHLLCAAQLVVNGNFQSGGTAWTCGALEINPETVYGGVTATNMVAEVDILANLCQDITGLTIGQSYDVSFIATRRNGGCPGPDPVDAYVRVDAGALVQLFSRSGAWNWVGSSYSFIATNTIHRLTFTPGPTQTTTCGILIDDVLIAPSIVFPLPEDLMASEVDGDVQLSWLPDADPFHAEYHVQRKSGAEEWAEIPVEFHWATDLGERHMARDVRTLNGPAEYRIQVSSNGVVRYSKVVAVNASLPQTAFSLSYNPNSQVYTLHAPDQRPYRYSIMDMQGKTLRQSAEMEGNQELAPDGLKPGIHLITIHHRNTASSLKFALF